MSTKNSNHSQSLERPTTATKKSQNMGVRKFSDLSPPQNNDNEAKKSKSTESDDESDDVLSIVREIRAEMKAMNTQMAVLSNDLKNRIAELSTDLTEARNDLKATKDQVKAIETKQAVVFTSLNTHEIRLNIIDQKSLETQLMITNLPKTLDTEKFLQALLNWTGNIVHESRIDSINFNAQKSSKTAFVHFQNQGDKDKMMKYVKQKQKDKNDKHIPILSEQILELSEDDPGRANIIYFQTPLTAINREIFEQAKKMKKAKSLEKYWLMKGSIHIKLQNQQKPIRIDSIEQLESLKTSTPMEAD